MRAKRHMALPGMLGGLTPGVVDTATAIRVMGVGDSLTNGLPGTDNLAYRPDLLRRMGELGHAIQFVGNNDHGQEMTDGWTWQNLVNAAGGRTVSEIDDDLPNGMRAGFPEIVILCAGVNDVTSGGSEAAIVSEVETLIDEILTWDQVQYLFVTDVTIKDAVPSECENFNSLLETAVAAYGSNVIWVETFAAADLRDGVHPTVAAYENIGETLADALADVFPVVSLADNSPRQYWASEGDFWLSTRDYAGTGLGPIYEDTAWSDPAEHGDTVATAEDLTLKLQFADSPTGPTYDDGSTAGVGPVLEFSGGGNLVDSLLMGSPCTLFIVGEFDSGDSSGYAIQFDSGGGGVVRVPWSSEVPGGSHAGLGFYDGTAHKGFDAGGADLDDFAVFAIRYQDDGNARLYKNGTQIGDDVAYTAWGGYADFVIINSSGLFRASDIVHIGADLSDADFADLNAYLMARNSIS